MNKLKIYYSVNIISDIEDPILNQIKDNLLPQFGEIIPWFGTGPVDDVREIYRYDKGALESSDVVIAEVSYPSHGVGMELMHAIHTGKPIIALAKEGQKVSRMVLGIDYEKFTFIWYRDLEELKPELTQAISKPPYSRLDRA